MIVPEITQAEEAEGADITSQTSPTRMRPWPTRMPDLLPDITDSDAWLMTPDLTSDLLSDITDVWFVCLPDICVIPLPPIPRQTGCETPRRNTPGPYPGLYPGPYPGPYSGPYPGPHPGPYPGCPSAEGERKDTAGRHVTIRDKARAAVCMIGGRLMARMRSGLGSGALFRVLGLGAALGKERPLELEP